MANGQVSSLGQGSVVKGVSIALVGLALTAAAGVLVPTGTNAAALTGQASTSATGTLVPSAARTMTGTEASFSQGFVYGTGRSLLQSSQGAAVANLTVPLLGQSSVMGQGLITPNADGTVPLVGTAIASAQGSVAAPNSIPLTGSASTSAAGSLGVTLRPTDPVGQVTTSAAGFVSIAANNVTVNISGSEIQSGQGVVDAMPILSTQVTTSASGTVVPVITIPLFGLVGALSQGALGIGQDPDDTAILSASGTATVTQSIPLLGTAITGATGTLSITGDVFQPLTGSASTSAAGTVSPVIAVAIVGQSIQAQQENVGAPGFASLTGQVIISQTGTLFVTNDRDQALTGSSCNSFTGLLSGNPRCVLTGQVQSTGIGILGRSGGNMQQPLTGASLTGTQGVLGLIGQDILPPGVANEGCSIVSQVVNEESPSPAITGAEGCFIQSGTAREV